MADTLIAQRLRELREKTGESQDTVAEACGISRVSLARYETAIREPKIQNAAKLARHYGVPTDYLMADEPEKPNAVEDEERKRYLSKLTEYTPAQLKELTDLAARLWPEEKKRRQS